MTVQVKILQADIFDSFASFEFRRKKNKLYCEN